MSKKQNIIIDNINIAELGYNALLKFTQKLYDELKQERQNRSIYQIERDQIRMFWEITKENLISLRSEMNLMETAAEDNIQNIDKVKKRARQQRLQQIYEHNINLKEVQSENAQILKSIALDCEKQITDLFNINTSLREKILQNNIDHTNQIKSLKIKHIEALKDKTKWMECQMSELMDRIEKQRNIIIEKITRKNEVELGQIENIKEKQIKLLLEQHKNEFEDMHSFYQEITISNQSLVSSLKQKLEVINVKNRSSDKQVTFLEKNNEQLKEFLEKNEKEKIKLEKKMGDCINDKKMMKYRQKEIDKYKKRLNDVMVEYDALEISYKQQKLACCSMKENFVRILLNLQQQISLEKKTLEYYINKFVQIFRELGEDHTILNSHSTVEVGVNSKISKQILVEDLHQKLKVLFLTYNSLVIKYKETLLNSSNAI